MSAFRSASVYLRDEFCGILSETEEGYRFCYDEAYASKEKASPVSLTLPVQSEPYESPVLFSYFDGLIPEGWLLQVVEHNWKVNAKDRFGILLIACKDPIGNVYVEEKR